MAAGPISTGVYFRSRFRKAPQVQKVSYPRRYITQELSSSLYRQITEGEVDQIVQSLIRAMRPAAVPASTKEEIERVLGVLLQEGYLAALLAKAREENR